METAATQTQPPNRNGEKGIVFAVNPYLQEAVLDTRIVSSERGETNRNKPGLGRNCRYRSYAEVAESLMTASGSSPVTGWP